MKRTVDIADLAVGFRADGRERTELVEAATAAMSSTDRADQIEIELRPGSPSRPRRRWDHADGDVRLWWQDGEVAIGHGDVTARTRGTTGVVGGRTDLRRALRQCLPYLLTHLLAPFDRFVLHAAAVANDEGAVLALGPTGSGKSTLAVRARAEGWSILGDDLVVVRADGDRAFVRGVARPVLAPGPALADAAVLGTPVDDDPRGRWQLAEPTETARWHPLLTTVVTEWDEDEPHRRPLPRNELVEWLVFSYLAARDDGRLRAYLPTAAMIARSGGSFLTQGAEPVRMPDLLEPAG